MPGTVVSRVSCKPHKPQTEELDRLPLPKRAFRSAGRDGMVACIIGNHSVLGRVCRNQGRAGFFGEEYESGLSYPCGRCSRFQPLPEPSLVEITSIYHDIAQTGIIFCDISTTYFDSENLKGFTLSTGTLRMTTWCGVWCGVHDNPTCARNIQTPEKSLTLPAGEYNALWLRLA